MGPQARSRCVTIRVLQTFKVREMSSLPTSNVGGTNHGIGVSHQFFLPQVRVAGTRYITRRPLADCGVSGSEFDCGRVR